MNNAPNAGNRLTLLEQATIKVDAGQELKGARDAAGNCTHISIAQRPQRIAQRFVGNHHQSRKRLAQLQNQEDCGGCRKRKDTQDRNRPCVAFRKKTDACEDECQPADQHDQERNGDRAARACEQEQALFADLDQGIVGAGLEKALFVRLRGELEKLGVEGWPLSACLEGTCFAEARAVLCPDSIHHYACVLSQHRAERQGFLSVQFQRVVQQNNIGGQLLDLAALGLVFSARGSDQKAKNEGGKRRDQRRALPHNVLGVAAQMPIRQFVADEDSKESAAKNAGEGRQGRQQRVHGRLTSILLGFKKVNAARAHFVITDRDVQKQSSMSEPIRGWFDRDQARLQSYMQRKSLCNHVSLSGASRGTPVRGCVGKKKDRVK